MNHIYRLIFNRATGAPQAVSEVGRKSGAGQGGQELNVSTFVARLSPLGLAIRLGIVGIVGGLAAPSAMATCATSGSTVTCTGVPTLPLFLNNFSSATNGLTVNVNSGAQMNATLGGHVMDLTGVNISLNNSGTLDPALLGLVSVLSGGAFIGTGATSTVSVLNNASGIMRGTGMLLGLNLTSIDGLAIGVNNAAAGTTRITNNGTITSTGLSVGGITLADTPVVGVYGGSQVNMTNSSTGVINGRIAFETSAAGNTFTNAGAITGGVSMGASSTNTFTAITGSTVQVGDGVQVSVGLGGLIGVNLTFAPTGTVDGGAGGTNSLILQNPIGVGGGTTGVGTASSATYVNFNNLTINSGTWTLQGPLVSGATTLNGGVAQFNNNATFGSGVITSNGGILQASNAGLNVSNLISLGAGGVTVQGTNATTLSGVISGSGGLTKVGSGQLNLSAANTYLGNTTLNGGTVQVSNNRAFSTGTLNFTGATSLSAPGTINLNNAVSLGGTMTATGTGALTLGGLISGSSGITKTGSGSLTLSGNNAYTGTTALNAGSLVVGSNTSLGTGSVNAANGTTLDANTAATLANNINLGGTLSVGGTNALTLGGVVAGIGGLVKNGAADLALGGANTYLGTTSLNSGRLVLASNTALGNGALNAAANTTLDSNTAVSLNNSVNLAGALSIGGSAGMTLAGTINGAGSLVKNGAANLGFTGNNNFLGGVTLNAGTLTVGGNSALGLGNLTVGGAATLDSSAAASAANNVVLNAGLTVGGTQGLTLGGVITGTGALTKNGAAALTLNGNNSFQGGTTLNAGTLTLGNAGSLGTGGLVVGGAATLDNSAALAVANALTLNAGLTVAGNNNLTLSGVLGGAGALNKNGLADLTLSGNNTFTGALNVVSGSVTTLSAGALGNTSGANIGSGASLNLGSNASLAALSGSGDVQIGAGNTLSVGGVSTDSLFDGSLSGSGGLTKVGSGSLSLTGINGLTGDTAVNGGTLNLNGSLASANVGVGSGATLTGTGSLLGAVNVANGGHLALNSGNTLSMGSLVMGSGSNLDANLGPASLTSLLNVGGNVTLNGTLNVTDAGGFGVGVYRLINYTGGLTNQGLVLGSVPIGFGTGDLALQTAVGNQVNLLVSAPNLNIRFWDGSQTIANGSVEGGAGTWSAGGTNWTSSNGLVNQPWASDFAVFQGTAGTVTVNGTQTFNGMQFASDGYNLVSGSAGQLTAVNGGSGNTAVRVDPGFTGTIGVNIDGAGTLAKLDSGTLVLNGANSYTGGTLLNGGTLVVGSNTALGTSQVTTANGTRLDSNTPVSLANAFDLAGTLTVAGSNSLALAGPIDGVGGIIKNGAASLTLSGNNSYLGNTVLNAGGLVLGANTALGAGTLNAAGGTTLDASSIVALNNAVNLGGAIGIGGTADMSLNGPVNGAGSLTKNGGAKLTLAAANGFLGGTTLNAGQLVVGNNGALGLGNLIVSGASTLDSSTAVALANAVTLNAGLAVGGSNDMTLGGVIGGAGSLTKNGAANLTLTGVNTYQGGTVLNAGTLTLPNAAALSTGAVTVNGGSTLTHAVPLTLANNFNVNAALTLAGISDLSLTGVLAGAGTVNKDGPADLALSGNNSFSGVFNVRGGSLSISGSAALGNHAGINLATGTSLNLGGSVNLQSLSGSGITTVGAGSMLSISGNDQTYTGSIVGAGGLIKRGSGTQVLSGVNSYSGGTFLEGGTLAVGSNSALGTGELSMDDNTTLAFVADGLRLSNPIRFTGVVDPIVDTGANTATLSGGIGGPSALTKLGTGTLVLAAANNNYTGATLVSQGTLRAGVANAFSAPSAHTIAAGATLDLAGHSQAIAALDNAGTVNLLSAGPGTVLTVSGPYVGNNGVLKMGTALVGSNSLSDQLVLSGPSAVASGRTTLQITNLGGLGAQTTGNGIEVVSARNGATTTATAFTLDGDHVDAGAFQYRLFVADANGQAGSWFLSTQAPPAATTPGATTPAIPVLPATPMYRAEVPLYAALPSVLRQGDLAMLGGLHRRGGDESGMAAAKAGSADASDNGWGGANRRAWGRVLGGTTTISQGGVTQAESRTSMGGFQAGVDLFANRLWNAGLYAGHLRADADVRGAYGPGGFVGYAGTLRTDNTYVGGYAAYANTEGFHADFVLQYGYHDVTAGSFGRSTLSGATSLMASTQVGQRFALGNGWGIEPQAQLIYHRMSLDNTGISGASVMQDTDNAVIGRIGARVAGDLSTSMGRLKPYAGVNLWHGFSGNDSTTFGGPAGATSIESAIGYMSTELTVGFTLGLTPSVSVYGQIGRLFHTGSGDARVRSSAQGTLGVNVAF
ncbi:Fluffing protein [Variovorax sp. PBL-H6]|uniref:autotransporter-associated beta strand repeat-containing protein n=1 Tax=Variovorax sp. PBL-H6 TaxID=434009 RepID=UPI001317CB9A|nr:autotransporter-associated beta strand repeat-containing protein [Variovorax sp. PBL-H6]VTU15320.1 Fluffing protein [Variovorax sp. PBL-H6]